MYIHDFDGFQGNISLLQINIYNLFEAPNPPNEKIHKSVARLHHLLKWSLNSSETEIHLSPCTGTRTQWGAVLYKGTVSILESNLPHMPPLCDHWKIEIITIQGTARK